MVFFSTTGLLLHVALFRLGTTHDCAIGQAGPSIWSRLPPPFPSEVRMRVIGLAVVLAFSLTFVPFVCEAQQPGKVFRVGILGNVPRTDVEGEHLWGRSSKDYKSSAMSRAEMSPSSTGHPRDIMIGSRRSRPSSSVLRLTSSLRPLRKTS
jgi:hypothetical protein